jgi:predicted nucleic acid-binding protein
LIADADADLHTPALCDVEVTGVLRRGLLAGLTTPHRAHEAVRALTALPMRRHDHQPLLATAIRLRDNFTAYDAMYASLALALGATLVTADEALARAARDHLGIEVA